MEILVALVVLVLAFAFLGYPLYAARPRAWASPSSGLADLIAQRDGIYATLRDLDLDYQLGKLDDGDYRERREKQVARAAGVLKQLDAWRDQSPNAAGDEELEREIAAFRQVKPSADGSDRARYCSNCGHPAGTDDRFCGKCGHALS
ncbi:MAG: zinc ribbon domain-containing protein [Rudaea sp.]